jgi:hypothetical protein
LNMTLTDYLRECLALFPDMERCCLRSSQSSN